MDRWRSDPSFKTIVLLLGLVVLAALIVSSVWAQGIDLPDEITIETVDGEDADQVNELDLAADEPFEVTISGIEEFDERFEWIVRLNGEIVDRERAEDSTATVRFDPETLEELEEGEEYELEVALSYRGEEVSDASDIRVVSIHQPGEARDGPVDSEIFTLSMNRSGIPPEPQPTQEIIMTGEFRAQEEPHDMTLSIEMFGDVGLSEDGLPEGIDVTAVSAESDAWSVEASPTEEGIELEVHGDGGPESGEIQLTIEFDASEAYEEFEAAEQAPEGTPSGAQYRIEDEAGDTSGTISTVLWGMPLHVVVETPDGERLTPDTDRENWEEYYEARAPPYDPSIEVYVGDGKLVTTSYTLPSADGVWPLVHSEDRYLRVNVDGFADPVVPLEEIDPEAHTRYENPYVLELPEGEELEITMNDQNGEPLPDGFLELENEDGIRYDLEADEDGVVRTPLQPGTYTGTALAHTAMPEWDIELNVVEGEVTEKEFVLTAPQVVDSSVEHVGGTEPDVDSIAVNSIFYEGAMIVGLMPEDGDPVTRADVDRFGVDKDPHDIAELGVDETTELRLTIELDGFEPDTLMWAARDADWEVVETDDDRTVVEIETKATEIQKIDEMRTGFGDQDSVEWPSGDADVADEEFEAVVEVWLWDFEALFDEADYMSGTSVMTNAQIFSVPEMEDGELSIYMAAPAETVDGEEHTGYYQAFLSDELLEEWNVEDPENDLQVVWAGEEEQFHVESVDGGVYIEVDPVHYSDGAMELRSLTYEPDDTWSVFGIPWYVPVAGMGLLAIIVGAVIVLRKK
ncbi:hypothetical protein OB919_11375 [Halobacteria archaeon AArc-curdl1]|uniref:Uncharacterized protein n=1 Tax=Natronosalvus hydrolyticus TaxID=2979988 RepID=A0AAP2ZAS2_9EURY|nr:hypothetical protein [Halobacteria archaeon AArc-curdl1]